MTEQKITDVDQPDGIDGDSYDLPDPARAAERVKEFLSWCGDGRLFPSEESVEDQVPPLFARDLQALANNVTSPAATRARPLTREQLGQRVLEVSVQWSRENYDRPGAGLAWDKMPEDVRELYMRVGEALFSLGMTFSPVPSAATQTAEQARTDANYFRHCDWPDCLRAYDVRTGPDPKVDGKPWVLIRSVHTLFCPEHQDVGHRPQRFEWAPGDKTIAMSCECGAREEGLTPTNTQRCIDWWSDHVLAVGSPVTETTKQAESEDDGDGFHCCMGPFADGSHATYCRQRCQDCKGDPDGPFRCRCRDLSGVTSETEKRP